jgi:hypothetical protein
MPIGETWHIGYADVVVFNGHAYLDSRAEKSGGGSGPVALRRDETGFHVIVTAHEAKFIEIPRLPSDLIPIASLTEQQPGATA